MEHFTCGNTAVIILVNTLIAKMFMTIVWRFKILSSKTPHAVKESDAFKTAHARQLNDAEYGPLFVALLLYMHSQGMSNPMACLLAVFGSITYFWSLVISLKFGGPIGATARYAALGLITWQLYKSLN